MNVDTTNNALPADTGSDRDNIEIDGSVARTVQHDNNITTYTIGNIGWVDALIAAGGDTYPADRDTITEQVRDAAAADGDRNKLTMLCTNDGTYGSRHVSIRRGRPFHGSEGHLAYLPRGKRRNGLRLGTVVDVQAGWADTNIIELRDRWANTVAKLPHFNAISGDELGELPRGRTNQVGAVYSYHHRGFGEGGASCVWFITDIDADERVANGYLWAPPQSTIVAEHGSISFDDLTRHGANIGAPRPWLTLADVNTFDDIDNLHDIFAASLAD